MQWVVELPFTKPLSLNDRTHYMVKAKAVAQWRLAASEGIVAAGVPACGRVRAELMYIPAQNRRRDPDNLVMSMKPVVDARVDAGVVPDDTQEFVERVWPSILESEPKREGGRFLFRVTQIP